jgi:hypothetical protein
MNKYKKWYHNIVENARSRTINIYTERHHIIPKSLGGTDDIENKVKLTAREHFICHWLLVKIYTTGDDHWKMLNALRIMRAENAKQNRYTTAITSRVYANLKEEYSILQSDKVSGKGNPMYGDKFFRSEDGKSKQRAAISGDKNGAKTDDARLKIRQHKLGKTRPEFSKEWKENLSAAKLGSNNNMFGKTHSEETRQKMRDKATGRKFSAEVIEKRAAAQRGLVRPKKLCPHCHQEISVNTYPRWHGDNCKLK